MDLPENLVQKLKVAKNILFFTGAGISAESGISTFRGEDGIWNKLKPEELANFDAFLNNPDRVWEWYQYRRKIINESFPNQGHLAIAEFENYFNKITVVTQNVDNLHRRAGSKNILELHGSIERNYCINCKKFFDEDYPFDKDHVPKCDICGGLIRPDVVWFGETLPQDVFTQAEVSANNCDICFIVGTSSVVFPAAYIPITAKQSGSFLVEINIEKTDISSSSDVTLIGKSGEILPLLLEKIKEFKN